MTTHYKNNDIKQKQYKTLALFDLDHTLIPVDSDQQWGQFLSRVGAVDPVNYAKENERFYQEYQKGTLNIQEFLNFGLNVLTKYSREKLEALQNEYIETVIKPNIKPQAQELLYNIRQTGAICVLVTATNSFVGLPIAKLFGFDEHHLIATEPNTKDNCPWYTTNAEFTGTVLGTPSFQGGKVTRIEEWLIKNRYTKECFNTIFAYSDSHNDIPMLEWANMPIATNPDNKMHEHALKNHWPILSLFP
ncbi:MAG: hypothetical protein RLZZ210_1641 [Pseudomonadota bacterium]|jgi:HAD superfamily hydrolase (TIGR01490 family)